MILCGKIWWGDDGGGERPVAYGTGEMKEERVEKFKELMVLSEKYKRKNQYD